MGLERKTNFFLGKTMFCETIRLDSKKMVFWFSLGKNGFGQENQLFPRKKIVLGRKTNLFLGKKWFWREKPTFS